ncbi:MAG TPA: hypothetical protein VF613_09345 [Longimicrobium sp.]
MSPAAPRRITCRAPSKSWSTLTWIWPPRTSKHGSPSWTTTWSQGLEGAGLPGAIVGTILSIQERFVQGGFEGGFDIVTGDVERLAGRKPRALRDLLSGAFPGR